jgi:membrane protease YdiL (CAAX protease family)
MTSEQRRRRLYLLVPHDGRGLGWWLSVSLAAGIGEEIAYRGVMFTLFFWLTSDWWGAAMICALFFALGHMVQGWKSAATIFFFGLGLHLLVRVTGALYVAIGVHFLYDLMAGIAYGLMGRYLELEPAATPQGA